MSEPEVCQDAAALAAVRLDLLHYYTFPGYLEHQSDIGIERRDCPRQYTLRVTERLRGLQTQGVCWVLNPTAGMTLLRSGRYKHDLVARTPSCYWNDPTLV